MDIPARFITFEGGDGAGKTTQLTKLCDVLFEAGVDYIRTREPGGTDGAHAIRQLLVEGDADRWDGTTELLLHYAARRDHVEKLVKPSLAAGKWVICDRFSDSTLAYQGYGHGVDKDAIADIHRVVVGDFMPDLTFLLDIDADVSAARTDARGAAEDRYESMGVGFQKKLREGFLAIAKAEPNRVKVIDASSSVEDVHQAVLRTLNQQYGLGLSI